MKNIDAIVVEVDNVVVLKSGRDVKELYRLAVTIVVTRKTNR